MFRACLGRSMRAPTTKVMRAIEGSSTSIGAPELGSAEAGHPELFRFVPISSFSFDLFRFAVLVSGIIRICSNLF